MNRLARGFLQTCLISLFLGLVPFMAIAQAPSQYQAGSPWPKYQADNRNSGVGIGSGSTGWVKWAHYPMFLEFTTIAADGTVYGGGSESDGTFLFALDGRTGQQKWRYEVNNYGMPSAPAIGANGTIYFGDGSGYVYALSSSGVLKWNYLLGSTDVGVLSPAIGADGTIYIAAQEANVFAALKDNGTYATVKWSTTALGTVTSCPAIGSDGTIYVGSANDNVYALTDDGSSETKKWSFATGGSIYSSPAIGPDGTIYIGSDDGKVYALTDNGTSVTKKWSFTTGGYVRSTPAVNSSGSVFVVSYDGNIYALNSESGKVKWAYNMGSVVTGSPAIASDGTVYDGNAAFDGSTGRLDWVIPGTQFFGPFFGGTSPSIGVDGTVYVSTIGEFYALGTPPPSFFKISPGSVASGQSCTGRLNLSRALAETQNVGIASDNSAVTFPPQVAIQQGQTSATFTIANGGVNVQTTVNITATIEGSSVSAKLTIYPAVISSFSVSPESVGSGQNTTGKVVLSGPAGPLGATVLLSSNNSAVILPSSEYIAPGDTAASFSITNNGVSAITQVTLTAKVGASIKTPTLTVYPPYVTSLTLASSAVTSGASTVGTVRLSFHPPPEGYVQVVPESSNKTAVPAPTPFKVYGESGTFPVATTAGLAAAALVTISATVPETGITKSTSLTVYPLPAVSSINLPQTDFVGGTTGVLCTIELSQKAPPGGFPVAMTSSNAGVAVPASLVFPAGAQTSNPAFTTYFVSSATTVTISASAGGASKSTSVVLEPAPIALTLTNSTVIGGQPANGWVKIYAITGAATTATLSSSSALVTVPSTVTVAKGNNEVEFQITTKTVTSSTPVVVRLVIGGLSEQATLTLTP